MRRLIRALEAAAGAGGYLAGITVVALALLITVGVFSRRVLGAPLLAADEVSGYLLLAIVFLGLAYTLRTGGHIRADLILEYVPPWTRRGLEAAATLLGLGFALVLLAGNWILVAEYWRRGTLSFKYLQIPLWIPGTLLVIGAGLLLLQLVAQLLDHLTGRSNSE